MATHPDLLQSFPLRVNAEANQHFVSESSSTKLFTNRFAKMLFTLSVQEKEQAGVRQAWETPIAERRQREYEQQDNFDSTETTTPKPQLSADDAPLPIARPSSRALHQYAAAAGSPTHSRPSSAASNGSGRTGSASSLHRNGSSNSRPGAADLCSPPSRSSRATTTGQNLGGHGGTTPSTTSNFGTSRISPPKRTTMMEQIMGSFRGIPQQQPPTNHHHHHPTAAPGQQQRPLPPHGANLRPTATTTASTLPSLGTLNNNSVGGSPFSPERNAVKPQILLSQRVADLLSSASGQPVPAATRSSGGAAPVSQGHRVGAGVYPMFRVPSTTPPTQSSR
eukprot:TRINITY_DN13878_c0_g1_i1.p1 TRINITY_DN13878_c0_g1~~TRINITY_DN13878_c0_g1_i1.p1  ORF type:complete len:388 (-),score=2.59 TRINITY_DN13878_c0_g1_i1:118-1125(-)